MMSEQLTELEGAVLTEIGHRGNSTAFRVRRAFEQSGAVWRGSAGAVYPAVRRLRERGLLVAEAIAGQRGGNRLALTDLGNQALVAWMLDFKRAADSGFDPFRLRAGLWAGLPPAVQKRHMVTLRSAVEKEIEILRAFAVDQDPIEKVEIDLAIRLQEIRLTWISERG